jgi:Raf kinase inhibitor-like YbhB/YbcL family protein
MKPTISGLMLATVVMLFACSSVLAEGMLVKSESFAEGGSIPTKFAADVCGGGGVSPQVGWTGFPEKTRSLVVLLIDADGANGLTVLHWAAYNISPDSSQLREGEGQQEGRGISLGKNVVGAIAYRGMCPPVGDTPHHYYLSLIATDLEPNVLRSGLTRDELMTAVKDHALVAQSYGGRYGR